MRLTSTGAAARQKYSHANMSDTKWRKLLSVIRDSGIKLANADVKFVDVEHTQPMTFNEHWPSVSTGSVIDTFEFGPVAFREIEWLEFPNVVKVSRPNKLPDKLINQDIMAMKTALDARAKFPLELNDNGLRIVGYSN